MSIKIRTEKVVLGSGLEARKVVSVQALAERDLPEMYLLEIPHCHSVGSNLWVNAAGIIGHLTTGGLYGEKLFQLYLESIRKCGDHLHTVNAVSAEKRKWWNGEETFVI